MTTIILHGELATALGRAEWGVMLTQPREACAFLEANTGKFYQYLQERHEATNGAVQYEVLVDGKTMGGVSPDLVSPEWWAVGVYARIDIIPRLRGATGLWQTIIGAVLVVVGVVVMAVTGWTGVGLAVGIGLVMGGLGMLVGGVAAMMSPSPRISGAASGSPFARTFLPPDATNGQKKEKESSTPSYLFSGVVNTTQQGNCVPIFYGGPMLIGSAHVSMAITGTSLADGILGTQRPPKTYETPYWQQAVWVRMFADPRGDVIYPTKKIPKITGLPFWTLAGSYSIPNTLPLSFGKAAGKKIPLGTTAMPSRTVRGFLRVIALLFRNPRNIKFKEALDLYNLYELDTVPNPSTASWERLMYGLALHFSPEP